MEIDIKQNFNRIPHKEIMCFLSNKISDKRFLRLIHVLMMPTVEGKVTTVNTIGRPQRSAVSPILANIYLHYVIDDWFKSISQSHFEGRAEMVRYVDDMVLKVESMHEDSRFYNVLPKRLAKFSLEMHTEKSSIIPAGHTAAMRAYKANAVCQHSNFWVSLAFGVGHVVVTGR